MRTPYHPYLAARQAKPYIDAFFWVEYDDEKVMRYYHGDVQITMEEWWESYG